MRRIRNLWKKFRDEVICWKETPFDIGKGMLLGFMIAYIFYDCLWLIFCMIPLLFPWMTWQRNKRRRVKREVLQKEFREMMLSISNSLSAGYSLENSIRTAGKELSILNGGKNGLLANELDMLISSMEMNEPVEKLLRQMAESVQLEELTQFSDIISIIKKNGGNLIEIIGKSVEHISQSMQIKEEIRTVTAAKQMEKQIMSIMPYFILFYVRLTNPGYFTVLYNNLAGNVIATLALIMLAAANIWAERVIQIEI